MIFSSKIIPGNERQIGRLQNQLAQLEADVITEHDEFVHVSGHAARDELAQMYQWLRPRIAVPTHGEARHLREHCALAREMQVPETILLENGAVARLTPGNAGVAGYVETGYLIHEGGRFYRADGDLMRARKRMLFEGSVFATVVVNKAGELLADPQVDAKGTLDPELDADLLEMLSDTVAARGRGSRRRRGYRRWQYPRGGPPGAAPAFASDAWQEAADRYSRRAGVVCLTKFAAQGRVKGEGENGNDRTPEPCCHCRA